MRHDVSIFCNNCIGAFVAHDFGLPFNSPTVNLAIPPADYIEYITRLTAHMGGPWREIESDKTWPVALLDDCIRLDLIHYKTSEAGEEAWRRREQRINPKHMCFILVETDGCTYEDLQRFDRLPYPHKVALVHKPYPEIQCAFQIKGYEEIGAVTDSYRFHKILPLRQYDQFGWLKFLKTV